MAAQEEKKSEPYNELNSLKADAEEYTGTDPIADAYAHLKLQTDRVSNTKDV